MSNRDFDTDTISAKVPAWKSSGDHSARKISGNHRRNIHSINRESIDPDEFDEEFQEEKVPERPVWKHSEPEEKLPAWKRSERAFGEPAWKQPERPKRETTLEDGQKRPVRKGGSSGNMQIEYRRIQLPESEPVREERRITPQGTVQRRVVQQGTVQQRAEQQRNQQRNQQRSVHRSEYGDNTARRSEKMRRSGHPAERGETRRRSGKSQKNDHKLPILTLIAALVILIGIIIVIVSLAKGGSDHTEAVENKPTAVVENIVTDTNSLPANTNTEGTSGADSDSSSIDQAAPTDPAMNTTENTENTSEETDNTNDELQE